MGRVFGEQGKVPGLRGHVGRRGGDGGHGGWKRRGA